MKTNTALAIVPAPEQLPVAAPGELLQMPDPLQALTRAYLEAKALEKVAAEEASRLSSEILTRLEALERRAVEVPGLGRIVYVAPVITQGLDARAAEVALSPPGSSSR